MFWSVFSRIRTEYGEILESLLMQSKFEKMWTRIAPNTDTFYVEKHLSTITFLAKDIGKINRNLEPNKAEAHGNFGKNLLKLCDDTISKHFEIYLIKC